MWRIAWLVLMVQAGIASAAAVASNGTASALPNLQTPLYALYLCSHPSPAASFFGFNYSTYNVTNAAAATRRSKSTAKLAACPAVDSSADVDSDQSFTVPISAKGTAPGPSLQPGVPYLLSFLRKPSLGAVDITFSVRLDGGARNDSTLFFRRTITLASLAPPAEEDTDTSRRRQLLSCTRAAAPRALFLDAAEEDATENDGQQLEGGLAIERARTLLGSSSGGSSSSGGGGGRSSGGSSSGGGRTGGSSSSGGGRAGGSSSSGGRSGGSSSGGGSARAGGSSTGSARSGGSSGSSGWSRNTRGTPRGASGSSSGSGGGTRSALSKTPGFKNYGLTGWGRTARPLALAGTAAMYPGVTYRGRSGNPVRFGGYHRYRRRHGYYYPDDGEYDYDGYDFYVPPEEAAYLGSPYWAFPPNQLNGTQQDDTLAYGLPAATAAALLVDGTAKDLPSSYTGTSVFKAGEAFQYQTDLEVAAASGAPACKPCDAGSCCGSARFANSNWEKLPLQANRRGTQLACGLVQDFVLDVALYLPANAASATVTVHSIYATLNASTPCGANSSSTADPSEPPLYITLVPGDIITPNASVPSPPFTYWRRSAAAPAAAPAAWLPRLLAGAAAVLLAAGAVL